MEPSDNFASQTSSLPAGVQDITRQRQALLEFPTHRNCEHKKSESSVNGSYLNHNEFTYSSWLLRKFQATNGSDATRSSNTSPLKLRPGHKSLVWQVTSLCHFHLDRRNPGQG
nr:uncharacterized protein LOC100939185 isoform X2 [Pongo abelii]